MKDADSRQKLIKLLLSGFFVFLLLHSFFSGFFVFLPKLTILIIIIGSSFLLKRQKEFIADWLFFLAVIYLSDTCRGLIYYLVSKLHLPVYAEYPVNLDKTIFGVVPSVFLQNNLLKNSDFGILEKLLTVFHGTHFVAFLIVGFIIWIKDKNYFNIYKKSFYILLAIGLSTYALLPTAPPWMASQLFGLMPPLVHFNLEIYNGYIPDLTAGFNTDPVAAMPSLHAAFPFLCSLLLWKKFRFKAVLFYIYTAIIIFTIVYTGDHYIADILAGILISILSFFFSNRVLLPLKNKPQTGIFSINKVKVLASIIILIVSILTGLAIKPELSHFYSDYYHLNFVDFTKKPEKARSSFLISLYLGEHEIRLNNKQKALEYLKQAYDLAKDERERKQVEFKIRNLNIKN